MAKKEQNQNISGAVQSILDRLAEVKTKAQLDELRLPIVQTGKGNEEVFRTLQKAFIKAKNKIKRIPLKDRLCD